MTRFAPSPRVSLLASFSSLLVLSLLAPPLAAQTTASSRAYGELVDLGSAGVGLVDSGPAPVAEGTAPPAYDETRTSAGESADDPSGGSFVLSTGQVTVHAVSTVPAADYVQADAEVNDLSILPNGLVRLTAEKVESLAAIQGVCGAALAQTADTVITNGQLVHPGGSMPIPNNPAPNTVFFDQGGMRVVLNEQVLGGDGRTAGSVDVNAIHVTLDSVLLSGVLYSGDMIVSHSDAEIQCSTDDGGGGGGGGGGGAGECAGVGSCRIEVAPAATLLIPYFAVDLGSASGRTTLFSVTNATAVRRLASVTLWTDWAVPTLTFNLALGPFDIETLNVRDLLQKAPPPLGSAAFPGCDGASVASDPQFLQRAHSGRSVLGGQCVASARADTAVATGYVTVDVVNRCSPLDPSDAGYFARGGTAVASNANALIGDVFWVTPEEDFAQGEPAVHLIADAEAFGPGDYTFYARYVEGDGRDARQPLGQRYAARFLSGGGFEGGTTLLVWRDSKSPAAAPVACGSLPAWARLESPGMVLWDEEENATIIGASSERFPWAAQEVAVGGDQLQVAVPFGWMQLDLGHDATPLFGDAAQGWVVVLHKAAGRYSTGHRAFRLDTACPGSD